MGAPRRQREAVHRCTVPGTGPSRRARPAAGEGDLRRYSRHLLLPEVGLAGQRRLLRGRVLVVGAGGLGAPASLYLAAAGVGHVGLVDFDRVDLSNLQRQIIYTTSDVGRPKGPAAAARLRALNPEIEVVVHEEPLHRGNARRILGPYDVVIDGTDNFATRYPDQRRVRPAREAGRLCLGLPIRRPGDDLRWAAWPLLPVPFPEPPPPGSVPSCAEAGVLGVVPGLLGLIQATEAIKLLLGLGETLVGRLMLVDLLSMRTRELTLRKSPECPICSPHPTQRDLVDYPALCGDGPRAPGAEIPTVSPEVLSRELDGPSPPLLVDVRTAAEWSLGHLPTAHHVPLAELEGRVRELPADGRSWRTARAGAGRRPRSNGSSRTADPTRGAFPGAWTRGRAGSRRLERPAPDLARRTYSRSGLPRPWASPIATSTSIPSSRCGRKRGPFLAPPRVRMWRRIFATPESSSNTWTRAGSSARCW